jgi:hypothetical protein
MKNHYPSHIDRFTTILTIGIFAVVAIVILSILFTDASDVPLLALGLPLLILASFAAFYLASIKAVVVTDSAVIVVRKLGERVYPMGEIAEVRPITDELNHSLRLFGNGGVFAYMGWFRSGALGTYQANANRRDARILLTFKSGKKLVLSADQSIDLAADIESRLHPM